MVDLDTFVTILYVTVDDFCKQLPPVSPHPGRRPSLDRSEVLTLAIVSQWARFFNERDFYRYADRHLRAAFPALPDRTQFNRLVREQHDALAHYAIHLADCLGAADARYEVIDATAAPTRNAKRRGRGWLPDEATIGWSNRLGWYEGFHLLLATLPNGAISGFGFGSAHVNDRELAEALFLRRSHLLPTPGAGCSSTNRYAADTGFASGRQQEEWERMYGVHVVAKPQGTAPGWSPLVRHRFASLRQIVETTNGHLLAVCRLDRDRPHQLLGFASRLAAKIALHNFCLWLNQFLGRPLLSWADLIDW
jgi:hypothetical protein